MLDRKINVLVFPAGSEIGLEIHNSLKCNLHIELFGASGKSDHAKYVYDTEHYIEDDLYISSPGFIERFNRLLRQYRIDVVLPTHDSVVLFLAQYRNILNAKILTSSYETTLIAREKKLTYALFRKYDFCPEIYTSSFENITFPIFLKPNIGQGGKGSFVVESINELNQKINNNPDLIICEYLDGEEFSIDCFSNRNRELLFIGPRTRERIQMGISFHSKAVPLTPEIERIAKTLNHELNFRGAWFFQLKKDNKGKLKLLEFAARQASTMALYRQIGVNFALLSIFDGLDIDIKILRNNCLIELDRCLYNRYKIGIEYNRVYIDFDDTIIVKGKVNEMALQYLYQCKNNNIEINLLTKHLYNLDESLKKYCLAKNLFDKIILLKSDEDKSKFILPENSIFIDNYYYDRERIRRELNIPVFDVDAIECLLK
jgi:hypothetical protein